MLKRDIACTTGKTEKNKRIWYLILQNSFHGIRDGVEGSLLKHQQVHLERSSKDEMTRL